MRTPARLRKRWNGGLELASHGDADISSRWSACKDGHGSGQKWHPSASFGSQAWSQRVQLTLPIVMVTSIINESGRILGTLFCTNWQNFDSWSEPNGSLFWGNDLESRLVEKNNFQQYIICLCLDLFAKSYVFRENCGNCQFKFA